MGAVPAHTVPTNKDEWIYHAAVSLRKHWSSAAQDFVIPTLPYKIQNIKYLKIIKYKMQNFSLVCLLLSNIPKFLGSKIHGAVFMGVFSELLRPKFKVQNTSNQFAKTI